MKKESVTPKKRAAAPKRVAIQETSHDKLLQEMSEWSNRIAQRAYEFFAASGFTHGHHMEDWLKAEKEFLKAVALEVEDSKEEFVVRAEVAGFDAKDLRIHLNGSHLVIAGQHQSTQGKKEKNADAYSEGMSRQIYCSLELPATIAAGKAHAELNSGVLALTLPKSEEPKPARPSAA